MLKLAFCADRVSVGCGSQCQLLNPAAHLGSATWGQSIPKKALVSRRSCPCQQFRSVLCRAAGTLDLSWLQLHMRRHVVL